MSADRWVEVSESQFAHETDGLNVVRDLLPDQSPYRAWSNFEFRDSRGNWHEVDLLLLGRDCLHLVELKYYTGRIRGNDLTWLRDGRRAEDSPLKLARRKAQYLASRLKDEFDDWVRERKVHNAPRGRDVIPFVKESVFLHHPKVSVELAGGSPVDLYGPDGLESQTGLPGISELVLAPPGRGEPIGANKEKILVDLLKRIGLVQRREREAGSWVLDGAATDDGEGWQDWLATHKFSPQERRRIRFHIVQDSAPDAERRRVRQVAEHEFRVTRRLIHEHVLRPDDLVESDLGVGLVYPYDPAFQPLDLWLASRPEGVPLDTRLDIIRQAGEALAYSHGHRIVHRGLAPRAIGVKEENGRVQVQVGDWQSVGAIDSAGLTGLTGGGATQLVSVDSAAAGFSAPEGALSRAVDRVRVDVFGLGALAFYILTGTPAVTSHAALRERVREQSGLDISPELPEVSSTIREAILAATRPDVSERTPDVTSFLANLQEPEAIPSEEIPDPLEARPGTVLEDRFRVERRLGAGSTALGLLVTDLAAKGTPERVLKVALDDRAAARLADEAEVLRQLDHPRLVRLIEGPLDVGGRRTLLLSSAGRETLGRELSGRPRLSLDLLERWGIDLLEALVALDRQGITHRDIKPANLGILESRSNRQKHLVLFDFSLTKAAATATQAGTPPYLDPFLTGKRDQFDSAAERYAAAVGLFEMATGHTPVYGDGMSDPAAIRAEATVELADFDPVAGPRLVPFFIRALAREAGKRHDTADEMLQEWRRCFGPATTVPDNADQLAEAATRDTALADSGLTPRALSALEPLQVLTVGDLLAVDPARLSVLGGAAEATRRQVRGRASQWRKRLKGTGHRGWRPIGTEGTLMPPHTMADLFLAAVRGGRGTTKVDLVSRILGVTGGVGAFATHGQLGASLPKPVSAMRVHQLMPELQDAWAGDPTTREPLHQLLEIVNKWLAELGGVATVAELGAYLMTQLVPDERSDDRTEQRLVDGLLRLALERRRALARGTDEVTDLAWRRRDARPILVATDETLLGIAETLGQAADRLVATVDTAGHDLLVPAGRTTEALTTALGMSAVPDALREPARLVRLAATTSSTAGASSVNELHHRSLSAARALALTLKTITPAQTFQPAEVRGRVAARFPALPALPTRPALDQIVEDSGLGLMFDETRRLYRSPAVGQDTTGLDTRRPTNVVPHSELLSEHGAIGQRLADSLARRSFLALGVAAASLPKAKDLLQSGYDATVIDLTETLLNAMRDLATSRGLPWPTVLAADAEPHSSRGSRGLHQLIDLSLPTVAAQVSEALAQESGSPVVLTDAALLARYGHLKMLGQWTDLSLPRGRALWLVVPQLYASQGPVIDGRSLPLAAPSQYVAVAADWIDQRRQRSISNGAPSDRIS